MGLSTTGGGSLPSNSCLVTDTMRVTQQPYLGSHAPHNRDSITIFVWSADFPPEVRRNLTVKLLESIPTNHYSCLKFIILFLNQVRFLLACATRFILNSRVLFGVAWLLFQEPEILREFNRAVQQALWSAMGLELLLFKID